MNKQNPDVVKKIEYAEQWLTKARTEFASGSPTMAASHVILAIAEMETLKNAIFGVEKTTLSIPKKKRGIKIDARPILAAAMFLFALGIFMHAPRYNPSMPIPGLVSDSNRIDSLISGLSERDLNLLNSIPQIEIPFFNEIGNTNETVTEQPQTNKSIPPSSKTKVTSTTKPIIKETKRTSMDSIPESESNPSFVISPESDLAPVTSKLDPNEISLEAIIVARESLKNE